MCTLGGNRWGPKDLTSCHPSGRWGLSSELLVSAYPITAGRWRVNQWINLWIPFSSLCFSCHRVFLCHICYAGCVYQRILRIIFKSLPTTRGITTLNCNNLEVIISMWCKLIFRPGLPLITKSEKVYIMQFLYFY